MRLKREGEPLPYDKNTIIPNTIKIRRNIIKASLKREVASWSIANTMTEGVRLRCATQNELAEFVRLKPVINT